MILVSQDDIQIIYLGMILKLLPRDDIGHDTVQIIFQVVASG
jgi:hypothetical protein